MVVRQASTSMLRSALPAQARRELSESMRGLSDLPVSPKERRWSGAVYESKQRRASRWLLLLLAVCGFAQYSWLRPHKQPAESSPPEPVSASDAPSKAPLSRKGRPHHPRTSHVKLHENGLAYFDTRAHGHHSSEHPILALMRNASVTWDEKLARQSKTLQEAVTEYKRRYRRNPPKGFDHWYRFARANGVVLVDEYDNIDHDIRPFFALEPQLLLERLSEYSRFPDVDSLVLGDRRIVLQPAVNHTEARPRTRAEKWLIEECCAGWLEPTQITITPSDGPSVLMGAEHRQMHLDAVKAGKTLSQIEANTPTYAALHGDTWWSAACPEKSRFRKHTMGLEAGNLPPGPSFVYDHAASMDLCRNPENQHAHGFTAWTGPVPIKLYPVFAHSRSAMHSDLRLAPLEQYDTHYERDDPDWEDKLFDKAGWRGSTTGTVFHRGSPWQHSQRVRMYWLANNATGLRRVHLPSVNVSMHEEEIEASRLGSHYLDFKFTGDIVQCDQRDGTCDMVRSAIPRAPSMHDDELMDYKYLLDIDGNAWSGRFHRLMSSNSLVLKSTIFDEWWSDRVQPWLHYVPVKVDYTDIFDIMAFFAGDMHGKGGHDHLAKRIASAGREWARQHWRIEDMQAYNSRLFLEWARLTALDRSKMEYTGP